MNQGDTIYRVTQSLDQLSQSWWRIDRASITDVADLITTTVIQSVSFPAHTPPESLASATWAQEPGAQVIVADERALAYQGWSTTEPTLPTAETLPEGTEADYLTWRADCYAAKEQGRPLPVLTPEAQRLALIHEYREGLKAW